MTNSEPSSTHSATPWYARLSRIGPFMVLKYRRNEGVGASVKCPACREDKRLMEFEPQLWCGSPVSLTPFV
jgi:hypothetical protein